MNVQSIRLNQILVEDKERLEKQLKTLNESLEKEQNSCDHLYVNFEFFAKKKQTKCVFCNKISKQLIKTPKIDATSYERICYRDLLQEEKNAKRFKDLQDLTIKILEKNSTLSKEELELELKKVIKSDEKFNKAVIKMIGRRRYTKGE